jgi:2-polyprenyl-3-methyl-5-hydroxy-6-metoxy-1,4-benzoquinol methylase
MSHSSVEDRCFKNPDQKMIEQQNTTKVPADLFPPCKICKSPTLIHGNTIVRKKHETTFFRCSDCGFVFVDEAPWLAEAYADPINLTDTGYVQRNLVCQTRVRMFIELFLNPSSVFLDYAAGYGLFVRLMRDQGYDFRWADAYCQNLFARGFESAIPLCGPYEAVTCFEVLEHLLDPLSFFTEISPTTGCIIFSTGILPNPVPELNNWWYFGLEHGQHVSIYSMKSLENLARQFGFNFVSDGVGFHAFTRNTISGKHFRRVDSGFWKRWINRTRHRESLSVADYSKLK